MINKKFNKQSLINLENIICMSNILTTLSPIDTYCDSFDDSTNTLTITQKLPKSVDLSKYTNKHLVVGDEIVKILSMTKNNDILTINVERNQFYTNRTESFINKKVRLVEIINTQGTNILKYEYTDGGSNITSSLFTVENTLGTLTLTDDFEKWSPLSKNRVYNCKAKSTVVYMFKGQDKEVILKSVALTDKVKINYGTKNEIKKITIPLRNILHKWFNKDINSNDTLKNLYPKEFFKTMFELRDDEVYYVNGIDETKLIKISFITLKKFKKFSELLQNYCANTTIRFVFDRFERVKIFSDIFIDNLVVDDKLDANITNIELSDDNKLVYNSMKLSLTENLPLYNFKDLGNNYVDFKMKITNAFKSNEMLGYNGRDYYPNIITIESSDMFEKCYLGDFVLAKCTWGNHQEFYGKVMNKINPNILKLQFFQWDKDYKTLPAGKYDYLTTLLNGTQSKYMDLYYLRYELPDIFRFTRKKGENEVQYSLEYPILPTIDNTPYFNDVVDITFGSASNLKVGQYSGVVDEIEGIYGVWSNNNLLYNMEYTQSNKNSNKPPIYVLSNMMREVTRGNSFSYEYYTFDNRNLEIEINKNQLTNTSDARLIFRNKLNIQSNQLKKSKELSRAGDYLLEIDNISNYHIGDVLMVVEPKDNPSALELEEYNKVLKNIKWVVKNKFTETESGSTKHYILVSSPFARRTQANKVYEFVKFPVESIVYLQEMYIKGNPIITNTQNIVGTTSDKSINGDSSYDLYDERPYDLPNSFLDSTEIKKLMGYVLNNFSAINDDTIKYSLPIEIYNKLHIEPLDIISIKDPQYTHIKETQKWLVLNTKISDETNMIKLTCININSLNTKPYELDTTEVLEYKPVEIPKYSNTGTDDTIGDGTTDSEKDEDIGQIWVAKISEGDLTANVKSYKNGLITFENFAGAKKDEYTNKLFQQGIEFVVDIDGEMIFVEAINSDTVMVKKRQLYKTERKEILPKQSVKFLNLTLHTDVDGTIRGRRIHIGDLNNYFSYDPVNGAVFSGKFKVGAGTNNTDNDLYNALNNSRVFRQATKPIDTEQIHIKNGDVWYNILENNSPYVFSNGVWVSVRDNLLNNNIEHSKIYYSDNEPTQEIQNNDFWVDTYSKPYHIYFRQNDNWVDFTNNNIQLDTGNRIMYTINNTPPTNANEGDIWFTKTNGFIRQVFKDNKWIDNRHNKVKQTLNNRHLYFAIPKYDDDIQNLDIYYDIEHKKVYMKQGSTYSLIDNNIVQINNNKVYFNDTMPVENLKQNDLWVDTDNNYIIYYYFNGVWNSPSFNLLRLKEETNNLSKSILNYSKSLITKIENYGEDNKLNPIEKQNLKKELAVIEENYKILLNKTDSLNINSATLKNYKDQLKNYLDNLFQDMTTSSDIDRDVLRDKFVKYYSEYEKLMTELVQTINDNTKSDISKDMIKLVGDKIKDFGATINNNIVAMGDKLREQLNGSIEIHYGSGIPTINKTPTTEWLTQDQKNEHIGDIFYSDNGKAYRFNKTNSGFNWTEIVNNDGLLKALKQSEKAQDTADGKRRVFLEKPTPPYDKGDIWIKDKEIYVATFGKLFNGNYNSSDWVKATKYTDDSALENYKRVVEGDISNLRNQIDGKIETHYSSTDPKSSWDTTLLKQQHIGDIWYNTQSKITYRWNGTTWQRFEVEDTFARTLAERKATIFTSQPTPPYKVGDIWIKDNEIYKTNKNRPNGNYNSSDWVKATKYTDDSALDTIKNNLIKKITFEVGGDANKYYPVRLRSIKKLTRLVVYRGYSQKAPNSWYNNSSTHHGSLYLEATVNFGSDWDGDANNIVVHKFNETYTNIASKLTIQHLPGVWLWLRGGGAVYHAYCDDYESNNNLTATIYLNGYDSHSEVGWSIESYHFRLSSGTFSETGSAETIKQLSLVDKIDEVNRQFTNADGRLTTLQRKYEATVQDVSNFKTETSDRIDTVQGALDNGNFVINQNTSFAQGVRFVSQGTNEVITIENGAITFHRDGKKLTRIKNSRYGSIATDSKGKGVVTFEGFKQPMIVLPTIKSANFGKNMASIFCYHEHVSGTTYRFYVGGTNETVEAIKPIKTVGKRWESSNALKSTLFGIGGFFSEEHLKFTAYGHNGEYANTFPNGTFSLFNGNSFSAKYAKNIIKTPEFIISVNQNGTKIFSKKYTINVEFDRKSGAIPNDNGVPEAFMQVNIQTTYVDTNLEITKIFKNRQNVNYELKINIIQPFLEVEFGDGMSRRFGFGDDKHIENSTIYYRGVIWKLKESFFKGAYITAGAYTSTLSDVIGDGEVQYIAMEID